MTTNANMEKWTGGRIEQVKRRRRIATRYDKLAADYAAFLNFASIRA